MVTRDDQAEKRAYSAVQTHHRNQQQGESFLFFYLKTCVISTRKSTTQALTFKLSNACGVIIIDDYFRDISRLILQE